MLVDELREITTDKWSDHNIWPATPSSSSAIPSTAPAPNPTASPQPSPRIHLFFALHDRWIADATREKIIKTKCSRQGGDGATEATSSSSTTYNRTKTGPIESKSSESDTTKPTLHKDGAGAATAIATTGGNTNVTAYTDLSGKIPHGFSERSRKSPPFFSLLRPELTCGGGDRRQQNRCGVGFGADFGG